MLAAVAGEPGVHVVGGAVRDALLRPGRRASSTSSSRATRSRSRAARRERVGGTLTVHERFGTATVQRRRLRVRPRGARRERYARPGALPDVELGATHRGGPGAARLHRQRDGGRPRRRRAHRLAGRARGPRRRACCASCTTRSFVDDPTRMLRLVRYAARLGFAPDPATEAADRSRAVRDRHRRSARQRAAAAAARAAPEALRGCSSATAWAQALLGDGFRVDVAGRARRPRACSRSRRAARRSRATRSPPASTTSGSRAQDRDVVVAAASGFERLRGRSLGRQRRRPVAPFAPRAARDRRSCSPPAGDAGRAALARPRPPPQALDLRRRPGRRGPDRRRGRRRARRARWSRCSTGAPPIAHRSSAAALM